MPDSLDRRNSTSRKESPLRSPLLVPQDSLSDWIAHYRQFAVIGIRSPGIAQKITLHLARFLAFFRASYGHERISTCLQRDAVAWQAQLQASGLAPATVNNHLASLPTFTTWVHAQAPLLFPAASAGLHEARLLPPAQVPSRLQEQPVLGVSRQDRQIAPVCFGLLDRCEIAPPPIRRLSYGRARSGPVIQYVQLGSQEVARCRGGWSPLS